MTTTWNTIANAIANLITNPTFSNNGADWTQTVGTWTFNGGAQCTVNPGIGQLDSTPILLATGVIYTMSITVVGRTQGQLDVLASAGSLSITSNGTFTTTWTQVVDDLTGINLIAESGPNFDGTITSVLVGVGTGTIFSWTNIPAPTGTTFTATGFAYGLLLAITRPGFIPSDIWTDIPTNPAIWTNIPNAV